MFLSANVRCPSFDCLRKYSKSKVPGRAGAVLLSARIPPKTLRVRLFLDLAEDEDAEGLSALRHEAVAWLASDAGCDFELPGEPGLVYRNAVCTGADAWDALFEDGSCEVEFTCFDPVAYGDGKSSAAGTLTVGGTWATWPVVTLTALAGPSVKVADGLGRYVLVEREFEAGDEVLLDFRSEAVTVDGADASAGVAVESTFFPLFPGSHSLAFSGCSAHTVEWVERWL